MRKHKGPLLYKGWRYFDLGHINDPHHAPSLFLCLLYAVCYGKNLFSSSQY